MGEEGPPPATVFRLGLYLGEGAWAAVRIGTGPTYAYRACRVPRGLALAREYRPLVDYVLERGTLTTGPPEYPEQP